MVRTPACHAGGRGFESRRSRSFHARSEPETVRPAQDTAARLCGNADAYGDRAVYARAKPKLEEPARVRA